MSALTFFDPTTKEGFALSDAKPLELHVHECGQMYLGAAWNYRDVCSPFWRAYYNVSAGAAVRAGGKKYPLGPERLVLLPEQVRFDCLSGEGVSHFWVHFSVAGLWPSPVAPVAVPLGLAERALWAGAVAETMKAAAGDTHRLRHLCAGMLLMALGKVDEVAAPGGSAELRSWLMWLERSLSESLDIPSMARQAGLGPRAFLNWFKAETGSTPMAYLKARRIREACRRLRFTAESIEAIAEGTGFANRYHFSRVFREQTGRTPANYRAQG